MIVLGKIEKQKTIPFDQKLDVIKAGFAPGYLFHFLTIDLNL